jgi:hypothetical protein
LQETSVKADGKQSSLPSSSLSLRPWRWRQYVSPKRQLTLNALHGVILVFQKIVLFTIHLKLLTTCLFCLIFDPEDAGNTFLRKSVKLTSDYTASHPRRQYCSQWEPRISQLSRKLGTLHEYYTLEVTSK